MKKIKLMIASAMVVSIFAIGSVSAQSNPNSRTTTTERYDDNNKTNYGWVGLIGLVGLAGFLKKNKEVPGAYQTTTPKYN